MLTIQFLCPLPNGLHARPAWELKEQCSQWQSEITFINHRQNAKADAKSSLALIGTGTLFNDSCSLNISGSDEEQARHYTARAVAEGFPVAVKAEVRAHKADAQRNENIKRVLSKLAEAGDREAIVLRSELFLDANEMDRAQALLERVADDPTACQLLAKIEYQRGNMDEAARHYIRARNGAERIEEIEQYIVGKIQQEEVDDRSWYRMAMGVAAGMGSIAGLGFGIIYYRFFSKKNCKK